MKKHIVVLMLLPWALTSLGQHSEFANLIVEYKLVHLIDSTQKDNPYSENFLLMVGKQSSKYDRYALIAKLADKAVNSSPVLGQPVYTERNKKTIYRDMLNNKSYIELTLDNKNYSVEEPLMPMNWEVHDSLKKIGNYQCQKATVRHKGRNYIGWFAPSLPYITGPWKFWGLPGLILEVCDEKREVQFLFQATYTPIPNASLIRLAPNSIKVSEKKYRDYERALQANKDALKGTTGDLSNLVAFTVGANSPMPAMKKTREVNNPIEKEDERERPIRNSKKQ